MLILFSRRSSRQDELCLTKGRQPQPFASGVNSELQPQRFASASKQRRHGGYALSFSPRAQGAGTGGKCKR